MNEPLMILIALNLLSFIVYGCDKYLAIHDKRRISEKNLHTLSIVGGFVGSTLAMMLFRHKIKKVKFMLIHSAIFIGWIFLLYFYFLSNFLNSSV
ncbi:DUF1294 domain-containing protein [Candidatus Marinarcus aquaticus]|uniref:DUF1294 domain-containing protein n=1 Tax=Candidatus Marinarcus aquaticus TaxID=2044504 RepID=A0A4Q0XPQ0_9BACT|nr:DUF1294 domain-containing protein [Candidatus Marinarcus aquaticus]RXJ56217.1 hypothetical protein CRV04_09225 [Candidatus Marinarcus aquaticus]